MKRKPHPATRQQRPHLVHLAELKKSGAQAFRQELQNNGARPLRLFVVHVGMRQVRAHQHEIALVKSSDVIAHVALARAAHDQRQFQLRMIVERAIETPLREKLPVLERAILSVINLFQYRSHIRILTSKAVLRQYDVKFVSVIVLKRVEMRRGKP
jgi:hypothetical protein